MRCTADNSCSSPSPTLIDRHIHSPLLRRKEARTQRRCYSHVKAGLGNSKRTVTKSTVTCPALREACPATQRCVIDHRHRSTKACDAYLERKATPLAFSLSVVSLPAKGPSCCRGSRLSSEIAQRGSARTLPSFYVRTRRCLPPFRSIKKYRHQS